MQLFPSLPGEWKRGRHGYTTGHFGIEAIQMAVDDGVKVAVTLRYAVDPAISFGETCFFIPYFADGVCYDNFTSILN